MNGSKEDGAFMFGFEIWENWQLTQYIRVQRMLDVSRIS